VRSKRITYFSDAPVDLQGIVRVSEMIRMNTLQDQQRVYSH
jgi:hypothetical protein